MNDNASGSYNMEYIRPDEFEERMMEYLNNGDEQALKSHFTVEDSDIKVAEIVKTETIVDGNKQTTLSISYKNLSFRGLSIGGTSMQFYLILGEVTRNPKFIMEVATLAQEKSKAQITIYNDITEKETTRIDNYTEHTIESKPVNQKGTVVVEYVPEPEKQEEKTRETKIIETTITPTLEVTSVDNWLYKKTTEYPQNSPNVTYNNTQSVTPPENDPIPENTDPTQLEDGQKEQWNTYTGSTESQKVTVTTHGQGVTSGAKENIDAFLKLLGTEYTLNSGGKSIAGEMLASDADMFFKLLSRHDSTRDMETVMRYILYKYNGINYGVTEFDFGTIDPDGFNEIGDVYGNGIGEYIKSYENNALRTYMNGTSSDYSSVKNYVNQDKTKYKMFYTDFDNCYNFSYGIMVSYDGTLNNEPYFKAEGLDLQSLVNQCESGQDVYVDVEILERIYEKIIEDKRKVIKEVFEKKGANIKPYELDALVDVSYQYGNCGQYISGSNNVAELYINYYARGNVEGFKNKAVKETGAGLQPIFTGSSYENRKTNDWILFTEGRYILSDGTEISGGSSAGISDVVQFAQQFVGEGPSRFTSYNPKNGVQDVWNNGAWCGMFVSYCFNECGLIPSVLPYPYASCGFIYDRYMAGDPRVKLVGNRRAWEGKTKVNYTPKSGDIIFFLWNDSNDTQASHTGIVKSCDGTKVYTIEGNSSGNIVSENSYVINNSNIIAYYSTSN